MRYNIVLDDKHKQMIEKFGKRHGFIATTGRKTGTVNTSAVIQFAIEKLPLVEAVMETKEETKNAAG